MNCPMYYGLIILHPEDQWGGGGTPFSMSYGLEAVIPLEFGFPTLRMDQFDVEENHNLLLHSLDLAEER